MSSEVIGDYMYEKLACPIESKGICKRLTARRLQDSEKEEAMDILKKGFPHVYEREHIFWDELLDTNPTIALEMNKKIIGVSSVRKPQLIKNRNTSWIDLIAIDPSVRRMGFGSVLLDQSENLMKKMGAKKTKLFTEVKNTNAVSFYSKHDWQVSDYTLWGYQHAHRLTMEKIL